MKAKGMESNIDIVRSRLYFLPMSRDAITLFYMKYLTKEETYYASRRALYWIIRYHVTRGELSR